MLLVKHFDGVAVEDSNNFALKVGSHARPDKEEQTP
jgi:hypothetical protein